MSRRVMSILCHRLAVVGF